MKRVSVSWLRDQIDELTSRIIRLRTAYCVTCGANWSLTCSHIFGRAHGPTRFDIDLKGNNVTQCLRCNLNHNKNKSILLDWFRAQYGRQALVVLEGRANSEKHWGYTELMELWGQYKMILQQEKGRAA